MKILYLLPGNVEIGLGFEELARRGRIIQEMAAEKTQIDISYIQSGPSSIESAYEEYLAAPGVIEGAVQAEKNDYDGVIVGCFGDPGLDGARECCTIPIVGPGENAVLTAAMLGHKFSIVTVLDEIIPSLEKLVLCAGVDRKLAGVRATNVSVLEINRNPEIACRRAIEEAIKCRDQDGADTIVLGCMSLAFARMEGAIAKETGLTVINPVYASVKTLEGLVSQGLSQSKKAYPMPPKLRG